MNPKFSKQPTLDYSRSKVNKAGRILADYDSDNPNITVRQLIANYCASSKTIGQNSP
ncbi:MAG: hypothetical protein HOG05_02650 [Bacteroidetes bacterium]|nr:hypothetical protein [Bacteroidota bacterium]